MVSEADAPPPDPPFVAAASPSGSAVPLDALSAVMESVIYQVEVACGLKADKKCPLPLGEDSNPELGSAIAGVSFPE